MAEDCLVMTQLATRPTAMQHPAATGSPIREIAIDFLMLASSGRAQDAWKRYCTPDFIHHNPWFPGDGESLIAAMDENAKANPDKQLVVQRTIVEGPLVMVHSSVQHGPTDRGAATVHIFRVEGGRIRELWDVGQEIPADSPNQYGMF
jgi:predicted SnoaL-like aldol condensation-catalyzing enzyme